MIIRVLIAEDEPPTLRRFKRMVEQADPDFVVAATAADGEQALALLAETPCDVVLTDVRMPVMDGLQLLDTVRRRYPECQVVMISGYQDFAYVKHAVQASATDYLLKPVSQDDMTTLLQRLKREYRRLQKEKIARQLSSTINRAEIQQDTGFKEPTDTRFLVCLFCAGPMPLTDEDVLPGNIALERFSIEETFEAVFPRFGGFIWAFMGNSQVERILIIEDTDLPAEAIASGMRMVMQQKTETPMSCAYVETGVMLPMIGKTIARLRKLLLSAIKIGEGVLVPLRPVTQENTPGLNDHAMAKTLADLLGRGQFSVGGGFWGDLPERIEKEGWTQQKIHDLLIKTFAYLEAERGKSPELTQARSLALEVLSSAISMEEFTKGMAGLEFLLGNERDKDEEAQRSIPAKVKHYLEEHYTEHVNNQVLSMEFGYVPGYISLLFRKAYGVSPSEFLLSLRMNRAKQIMREHPERLIRDVAEQVGFKSQHHFSRNFKKHEGVWPTDYVTDRR